MSISVQSSTAALIALENLTSPNAPASESNLAQPNAVSDAAPAAGLQPSSVWDVSGAAPTDAFTAPIADLSGAATIADAAVSAGGVVTDLLAQMRQAALGASDPSLSSAARSALNASFQADMAKIAPTVAQGAANGVNLIDGSIAGAVQQPVDGGASVTLSATNLSLGGPLIGLSANANLLDPTTAGAIAGSLDTALGVVDAAVGHIAAQGQAIEAHLDVVTQASLASSGLTGAVSPDLDQDGARLQALQLQQQLQAGGLAVANQAPQAILALFR